MNASSKLKVRAGNSVYEVEYTQGGDIVDIKIDGRDYRADVTSIYQEFYSILIDGRSVEAYVSGRDNRFTVGFNGHDFDVEFFDPRARKVGADVDKAVAEGKQPIQAPMAGRIVKVLVEKDDQVQEGEGLIILEAMKMENKIVSQGMGTVLNILVSDDDTVESGQDLMVIDMGSK
jgi:biotin carboxyl carrier protein